jgi:hypothetical protein
LSITKEAIITKIVKGNHNNYWFCSKGNGLYKLSPENELISYSSLNELPSNIINDISFTNNNECLLSTNKGLFFTNFGNGNKFNNWNNIFAEEVNSTYLFNNKLYLATKNGLVIINEEKMHSFKGFNFNLASIIINKKSIAKSSLDRLNFNENSIEFNFDLVKYSRNPPDIKYNLIGPIIKNDISKNQQIYFQNLAPGSYTLTVAPDIISNKDYVISIPFTIIPAYWQTTWFIVICSLLFFMVLFFVIILIFKNKRRKEFEKNNVNRLILEYKLIALKAQINPHFISNCLTAIQYLVINNMVNEAIQYISKFSLLVRQVLNFSSKSMVSLKEELEITELNIELEQLRFENKFNFEIISYDSADLERIIVPPLIIQPIIENAIWHGLLPLKNFRKGKLIIQIESNKDFLIIIIEDNGIGRVNVGNRFGNLKESKGLEITRQRIQNLNNLYHENSGDLIIEDLVDNLNNAIGTRVKIILPLLTIDNYENKDINN